MIYASGMVTEVFSPIPLGWVVRFEDPSYPNDPTANYYEHAVGIVTKTSIIPDTGSGEEVEIEHIFASHANNEIQVVPDPTRAPSIRVYYVGVDRAMAIVDTQTWVEE